MTENIPEKVSLVALPSDSLKMLPDGIFESLVIVGDDQISPSLQLLQDDIPGCFTFTAPEVQPQCFPLSLGDDAGGGQGRYGRQAPVLSQLHR